MGTESETARGETPMRSSRVPEKSRARPSRRRERVAIASKSRPVVEAGRFGAGDVPHRVVDATVTGWPLGGEQPRGKLVGVHGEGSARTTRAIYRRLRTHACLSGRWVARIRSIRSSSHSRRKKARRPRRSPDTARETPVVEATRERSRAASSWEFERRSARSLYALRPTTCTCESRAGGVASRKTSTNVTRRVQRQEDWEKIVDEFGPNNNAIFGFATRA